MTEQVKKALDLYSRNVLDDGSRLYLIDWEYAAMADPLFDLATSPSADFFSDEEMNHPPIMEIAILGGCLNRSL